MVRLRDTFLFNLWTSTQELDLATGLKRNEKKGTYPSLTSLKYNLLR